MIDTLSIVTLILVGICFASAIFHAFAAFIPPFSRTHLFFFLTLVGIALFELFHLLAFKSPTLNDYVTNLRWELSAILFFSIFLTWFVRDYCESKSKIFESVFSLCLAAGFIINLVQSNTLQYKQIHSIKSLEVYQGSQLTYVNGDISVAFCLVAIMIFISFLLIMARLYKHYRQTKSTTSLIMTLSTILLIITGFQGVMVRIEVLHGIHYGPFGVMAMVITMSVALIRELVLALRESEYRYRSLVEQSPFSFQLLHPNGNTLRVNHAWEKLWGVHGDILINRNLLEEKFIINNGILPYLEKGLNGEAVEIPATKFILPVNQESELPQSEKWIQGFIYPINDENGLIKEVVLQHEDISEKKRLVDAFRAAASVFPGFFGPSLFNNLVESISTLMDIEYVLIASPDAKNARRLKSLAFCKKGSILENVEFTIDGSPLENIYSRGNLLDNYNSATILPHSFFCCFKVQSILARALMDAESKPLGVLLLFDSRRFSNIDSLQAVVDIFAARASAEIERNKAYELMRQQQAHLQNLVDMRTQELTLANKELEAFSYSVSHDLRAPLRSISGFATILTEDFKNLFTREAIGYISRIEQNANYMSELIDDLLQLSRVSRFTINRTRVNLSELVKTSVKRLQEIDPRENATIDIEPNIIVEGDRNLLSIAIDNLVSNAWKYTSKTQYTIIECGQKEINGFPVYYIKDNGAGFDMKFSHKLFTAFNRLHSSDDFQGTGIGLATVSRIISRHNGKIWAEAQLNQGASFYFTLQNRHANLAAAVN